MYINPLFFYNQLLHLPLLALFRFGQSKSTDPGRASPRDPPSYKLLVIIPDCRYNRCNLHLGLLHGLN